MIGRRTLVAGAAWPAIRRARPLIAGFESGQETIPVGGLGLAR